MCLTHLSPNRHLNWLTVDAGTVVTTEGDIGDAFYIAFHGRLEVSCKGQVVGLVSAGHSFGERALDFDEPRSATVTAIEPCDLLVLPSFKFKMLTGIEEVSFKNGY